VEQENEGAPIKTHLEELRSALLKALLGLGAAIVISIFFTPRLIDFLAQPVGGLDKLQAIEVTETISVYMRVALLAGGILASPWIFYQFFSFLAKGLKPKERSNILIAVPFAVLFFCRGRCFRVSGDAPIGTQFFHSVDGRADVFTDKVVFCVRHKPYLLDRDEL